MAVIHRHLVTTHAPCAAPRAGMLIQGGITATYARLLEVFGTPDLSSARPETLAASDSTLWVIATPAGRTHLSTWADITHLTKRPGTGHRWTIQAADTSALPWIHKATHGSTTGFPSGRHPDARPTRAELALAYLHYLLDRLIGQRERACLHTPGSDQHRRTRDLARYIEGLLPPLQRILSDHRWAPPGADVRPSTPAHCGSGPGGASGRASGQPRPDGSDEGLAQALRALAARQTDTRPPVPPTCHPGNLPETTATFGAEHAATLRAVADTVLPAPRRSCPIRLESAGEGDR